MENIKIQNEEEKLGTDLTEQAVAEAQERIKMELETAQVKSKDGYFTKIKIRELNDDVLILLNELTKQFGEPFSEEVMNMAKEFYFKNNDLLEGDNSYDPIRPENEKEFFIEQIMKYPDVFRQCIFENSKRDNSQSFIESQV